MSILGYIFDLERIIRKYLVLIESRLRNDILVLFIELFRVHTNQRSASRYFSLSLLKLYILLPSICCLWNKQSFLLPPPFSFFLFACMHKVGFISYKTKCQYFLKPWCETSDPVATWHRTLNFDPMAETLGWLKVMPVNMIPILEGHLISKRNFVHSTELLSIVKLFSILNMWAKRHFL